MNLGRASWQKGFGFCQRVFFLGVLFALPWIAFTLYVQFVERVPPEAIWLVFFVLFLYSAFLTALLWRSSRDPFFSLANLVSAVRGGDYSQRVITGKGSDPVGVLEHEFNQLIDSLRDNRLARMEDTFLLQNLIDKLDLAIAVFDGEDRLAMANPAFGRLHGRPMSEIAGLPPESLGLAGLLRGESESTHWLDFPARSSRFMVHRTEFRQAGKARTMILLTDLKNPLREEERTAWKRLIRVMGHELNNSLTPVISLADSLKKRLASMDMDEEERRDFEEALSVISSRAMHLNHFMQDYSRLAKLPEPRRETVPVRELLSRVVQLENDARVAVEAGPDCALIVDSAQIENLFINVVKNALDAIGPDAAGSVRISWKRTAMEAVLFVDDNGPGLSGTENLFVPFYSTKREGSGIGLVLSRQIAEANSGSLNLGNRPEGGCRATIVLPLYQNENQVVSE